MFIRFEHSDIFGCLPRDFLVSFRSVQGRVDSLAVQKKPLSTEKSCLSFQIKPPTSVKVRLPRKTAIHLQDAFQQKASLQQLQRCDPVLHTTRSETALAMLDASLATS